MAEEHRNRRYRNHHHHHHKKRRLKKRIVYVLVTILFCVALAALISTGTSNVYAVTGKITLYGAAVISLIVLIFMVLYQMIGRKH